jgi:membrane protein
VSERSALSDPAGFAREIDRERAAEPGRGRTAGRPQEIPPPGWRDIALRVYRSIQRDNIGLIAAGIALYALMAAFPALTALVSIYGLFFSPRDVAQHAAELTSIMPPAAAQILTDQLDTLARTDDNALSLGVIGGVLLALWGARRAMASMMIAMNIAYDEIEHRGLIKKAVVSLGLTACGIVGFIVIVLLGVATPMLLNMLPSGSALEIMLEPVRWIALWAFVIATLAVVYRYAPCRHDARWRWVTWGSVIAASLWLVASGLFTLYVANFGHYTETYGTLGGVIVLLLWLWLSGVITIVGAEINAEMEHQTAADTTTGRPRPLGKRGARVADTVGAAAGAQH